MSAGVPMGTVTFLFTDIKDSAKLPQRHHHILQSAIEANQGYAFQVIGDPFCAAFHAAVMTLVQSNGLHVVSTAGWDPGRS